VEPKTASNLLNGGLPIEPGAGTFTDEIMVDNTQLNVVRYLQKLL